MTRAFLSRLTYANIMSSVALFLALGGGTAMALQGRNTVDSGDIINQQVKSPDLENNGVESVDLRNGEVKSPDLENGGVRSWDLENNGVMSVDLENGGVRSVDLRDGEVKSPDLENGGVRSWDLENNGVETVDLADDSVTSAKIQNGAVTGDDVADGSIRRADTSVFDKTIFIDPPPIADGKCFTNTETGGVFDKVEVGDVGYTYPTASVAEGLMIQTGIWQTVTGEFKSKICNLSGKTIDDSERPYGVRLVR